MSPEELEHAKSALAFERDKWQEHRSLEIRKLWLNAASVGVPLLILAATIVAGIIQAHHSRMQDIKLKVAEAVNSSDNALAARNRIAVLTTLFPRELSEDYIRSAEEARGRTVSSGPDVKRLIGLLSKSTTDQKIAMLRMWLLVFPRDRGRLLPLLLSEAPEIAAAVSLSEPKQQLVFHVPSPGAEMLAILQFLSPDGLSTLLSNTIATTYSDDKRCKGHNEHRELVEFGLFVEMTRNDLKEEYRDAPCGFRRSDSGEKAREKLLIWLNTIVEESKVTRAAD